MTDGRRRTLSVLVNVFLVAVVILCGWITWQEILSPLPPPGQVESRLSGTARSEDLVEVKIQGNDAVLVYDLSGEPYFDEQQRYANDLRAPAEQILSDFRRVETVRVTVKQGKERYEGISITDGFGVILSRF